MGVLSRIWLSRSFVSRQFKSFNGLRSDGQQNSMKVQNRSHILHVMCLMVIGVISAFGCSQALSKQTFAETKTIKKSSRLFISGTCTNKEPSNHKTSWKPDDGTLRQSYFDFVTIEYVLMTGETVTSSCYFDLRPGVHLRVKNR